MAFFSFHPVSIYAFKKQWLFKGQWVASQHSKVRKQLACKSCPLPCELLVWSGELGIGTALSSCLHETRQKNPFLPPGEHPGHGKVLIHSVHKGSQQVFSHRC